MDQPEKKKSFHKRRKEEWKKRKSTKKTSFIIKEESEKKEEKKKEHFFKEAKTRPPSFKFILFTLMALYMFRVGAATPMDPSGYRPAATKTDFRD